MPRVLVLVVLVLGLGLVSPSVAAADVCVEIDEARDALGAEDRVAARMLLERQLIAAGKTVAADPAACTERWTVAHVALGGSLTVTLQGPAGARTATVASAAELGAAYAAMVEALFAPPSAAEVPVVSPVVEPPPALAPVPAPRAPVIRRRGAFLARVGYGVRFSTSDDREGMHGTTFGLAYRRATERFGFEVSALNLLLYRQDDENEVVWESFVKLGGFVYVPGAPVRDSFAGLALSYGDSRVRWRPPGQTYWNNRTECGPQAELSIGAQLLSSSVFEVDAMLNLILPLYAVDISTSGSASAESAWSPGLTASLSVGF
jgi:hypothetical protein